MFNENKLWHSVQARRAFRRQERNSRTQKRRRLREKVYEKRFFESRPFLKKAKFETLSHDEYRYERYRKWYGSDRAKQIYHQEVNPTSNKFWWEQQFDHEKYITAKGRSWFRKKREEEEQKIRDNFKVFLNSVPHVQHKRLKQWLDHCDKRGEYKTLFEDEDGIDEDAFLFEEEAYSRVDWPEVMPVPIMTTILFLSKSWPEHTIPEHTIPVHTRVDENIEEEDSAWPDTGNDVSEWHEQVVNSDSDSEYEFTAGF
tara:strand:+ start:19150 stop:19917 length:768 start_codon:yes stop_codon:yes gene_type:complete